MGVQTYKVVTGKQEIELIEADTVELDSDRGRLNLYLDGDIVGSFVGYSSFNVFAPVSEKQE